MKRIFALILTLTLLFTLAACGSPYDKPEKYVSLPPLSEITVKNSEVDSTLKNVMEDLLDDLTGEHFIPVTDPSEKVKEGDKVYITYTGTPKKADLTLSDAAKNALSATEKDYAFLIPGTGMLPDAMETIVVGTKAGDTVSTTVTYTKDDTDIADLVGVEIDLEIKILRFSRLTVSDRHAVKLQFTATLDEGVEVTAAMKPYLTGSVETVDFTDSEDTFNELFTVSELFPHVEGANKRDTLHFSLTLDSTRGAELGYENGVTIHFTATVLEASETPTALTDEMVKDLTYGEYGTVEEYVTFCRKLSKENLAIQTVASKATFSDKLPKKEYKKLYEENYNEALYDYIGYGYDYSTEEMAAMLTEDALAKIEATADENTVAELRERLLLEYLYDLLDLSLTDKEYTNALNDLYKTYQIEYSYMLYYYGINKAADLEAYLGKDYLEVQFLYEKLLPLLAEKIQFVD